MPFNLILLPLLGGYLLVSRTHLFAFKAAKQSRERLVFMAAFAAVGLVIVSRMIVLITVDMWSPVGVLWRQFFPLPYSGTASLALGLGIIGPWLINCLIPLNIASKLAIQQHGNGLDRLFYAATEHDSQVLITLETGKVYAGWLDWMPPNPGATDAYVRILPTISGFRTPKNRVEWTTFYQAVYLGLDQDTSEEVIESFTKVIPIGRIVTVGLSDPQLYDRFHPRKVSDTAADTATV